MRIRIGAGTLAALLGAGRLLAATGGTIQDQAVSFAYPASHWSVTAAADLVGAWTSPAADVLHAEGFWYRAPSDTREHRFPPPDTESYLGGDLTLVWNNVDGKGFKATQVTHVVDNERPSGTLLTELRLENLTSSPMIVNVYHYLDVDIPGNGDDDNAMWIAGAYELSFYSSHGGGAIRYRSMEGGLFRVAPYPDLLDALDDDVVTSLSNDGAPLGPGNATAAYQSAYYMNPGQPAGGGISISVRPKGNYIKGEGARHTGFPALWFCRSSPVPAQDGLLYRWDMRRTSALLPELLYGGVCHANRQVLVGDKFRGEFTSYATYDTTTGRTEIGGVQVTGVLPAALPAVWRIEATGDFDSDGLPDIVWRNAMTHKILIWRIGYDGPGVGNPWLGNIVPVPDQAADANWAIRGALDFNGDGRRDLLWYNSTSGKAVIWHMNAAVERISGAFTTPSNAGDNNWNIVAAGDYGKGPVTGGAPAPVFGAADIVWRNATSGRLVVWHMNFSGQRTAGVFTTPDSPSDALNVRIVGPR